MGRGSLLTTLKGGKSDCCRYNYHHLLPPYGCLTPKRIILVQADANPSPSASDPVTSVVVDPMYPRSSLSHSRGCWGKQEGR